MYSKPINKQTAFKTHFNKIFAFFETSASRNEFRWHLFWKWSFCQQNWHLSWVELSLSDTPKAFAYYLLYWQQKTKRSKANVCFAIYLSICIRFTDDVWMRRSSSTSSFYYVQHVVIMIIVGVYVVLWSTIAAKANFEPLSCTVSCILNKWHDTYHWSHLNKGKVCCGCVYCCLLLLLLLWLWLLHRHILVNAFAMKWTKQK